MLKPFPQISLGESGWLGAGIANSVVFTVNSLDDCTQSVLGAGLAGLDRAGGWQDCSRDWVAARAICTLQAVHPKERFASVAEGMLFSREFVINKEDAV